jgi:hypothetical protein
MTAEGLTVATAEPERLRSDPVDVAVEVGEPHAVELHAALVLHVSARGVGPEEAGVVGLALVRQDLVDRQSVQRPIAVEEAQ